MAACGTRQRTMAAKPCPCGASWRQSLALGRLCSSSKLPSRGRARKQQRIFQRNGPCGLTGEGNLSMLVHHCNDVTGTRHGQQLTVAEAATSGKHMTAIATFHRPMHKQAAATNLPSLEARVYNRAAARQRLLPMRCRWLVCQCDMCARQPLQKLPYGYTSQAAGCLPLYVRPPVGCNAAHSRRAAFNALRNSC